MFQIPGQVNQPGRVRCHIALLGGHWCYPPSGSDHPARPSDQKAPGARFHDHLQEGLHPGGMFFEAPVWWNEFLVGELGTHQRISKPRRQKSFLEMCNDLYFIFSGWPLGSTCPHKLLPMDLQLQARLSTSPGRCPQAPAPACSVVIGHGHHHGIAAII